VAELYGLTDGPVDPLDVTVPAGRSPAPTAGVRYHRSDRARRERHPTRTPPQTRLEEALVDLTQLARDPAEAVAWLLRACARRVTTAARLRTALAARPKLRWRALLTAAVDDADAGAHSVLELAFLRRVERAHGLPRGERQAPRSRPGGRWYDDVHYRPYGVVVELDGVRAHPAEAGRDGRRDNAAAVAGLTVLRYRFTDVMLDPCAVASQLAAVLHARAWPALPRPCGPACAAPDP
jgi:hypothetical protein